MFAKIKVTEAGHHAVSNSIICSYLDYHIIVHHQSVFYNAFRITTFYHTGMSSLNDGLNTPKSNTDAYFTVCSTCYVQFSKLYTGYCRQPIFARFVSRRNSKLYTVYSKSVYSK